MKFNELFHHNDFIGRHLSLSDRAALLAALGEKDVSSFVEHTVPQSVRMPGSLRLHARLGFVETGRMPQVGRKFGRWLDLVFMQRFVQEWDA